MKKYFLSVQDEPILVLVSVVGKHKVAVRDMVDALPYVDATRGAKGKTRFLARFSTLAERSDLEDLENKIIEIVGKE